MQDIGLCLMYIIHEIYMYIIHNTCHYVYIIYIVHVHVYNIITYKHVRMIVVYMFCISVGFVVCN